MSRARLAILAIPYGFPRVSGDEPDVPSADQPHYVFSPRERG